MRCKNIHHRYKECDGVTMRMIERVIGVSTPTIRSCSRELLRAYLDLDEP